MTSLWVHYLLWKLEKSKIGNVYFRNLLCFFYSVWLLFIKTSFFRNCLLLSPDLCLVSADLYSNFNVSKIRHIIFPSTWVFFFLFLSLIWNFRSTLTFIPFIHSFPKDHYVSLILTYLLGYPHGPHQLPWILTLTS